MLCRGRTILGWRIMKLIVLTSTWLAAFLLSACVNLNDAAMRLLASSSPAFAIINDKVFEGTAQLYTDRSGKLDLQSEADPLVKCMGNLRRTATRGGVITLRCNDGIEVFVNFILLSEASGHGTGGTGQGMLSLTYGLSKNEAAAYLKLPATRSAESANEPSLKPSL
jgi:hypothetical protein